MTGFFRDYAGSGWAGAASAGVSGDGNHDISSNAANPNVGSLNGHGIATFAPGKTTLSFEGTLDRYFDDDSLSGWILFDKTGMSSYVLFDSNFLFQLELDSSTSTFLLNNEGESQSTIVTTSNAWQLITWRWDGAKTEIGKNGAPSVSKAYATPIHDMGGSLGIETLSTGGSIAEIGLSDQILTDDDFTNIKTYINARYGLSL